MPNLHGTPGERIADLREQRGLKKKELADFVIDSSKSFENTEKQVLEIIEKLKEKCDGCSC